MQVEGGTRRVWRRGLLFSVFVAPLLGSLLAATLMIAVKGEPPSVPKLFVIAITIAYVVGTVPTLVAGAVYISLAQRWRSHGLSRRSIVLRLAVVGIALGA